LGVTDGTTGTYNVGLGDPAKTGDYFFGTNNSTLYYCYSASNSLFAEVQGRQGNQGNQGPTGIGVPVGNDSEIQYKSGSSFSANSLSSIVTTNLFPASGYSGNIVHHSQSVKHDSDSYQLGGTITLEFGSYNIYVADSIQMGNKNAQSSELSITGFNDAITGQSMALVLNYQKAGNTNSIDTIVFPSSIKWLDGIPGISITVDSVTPKIDSFHFLKATSNLLLGKYNSEYL
jgi:hypothetical protein